MSTQEDLPSGSSAYYKDINSRHDVEMLVIFGQSVMPAEGMLELGIPLYT